MEEHEMRIASIGEIIRERNITLDTQDPIVRGGFTQIPNFILKMPMLSVGAKVVYAMFLHYAWNNDSCFPGQDRLATDIGMSRSRVTEFIGELEKAGLVAITRRGMGRTNLYSVKFVVRNRAARRTRTRDVGRPTSDVGRPTS